jgi:hypothetical protein
LQGLKSPCGRSDHHDVALAQGVTPSGCDEETGVIGSLSESCPWLLQ